MFVAVCYDVSNNRKRRQVVKVLEGFGQRVQKSVFECQFGDKQFVELKRRLSKIQLPEGDLVRYYCLCQACQGADRILRRAAAGFAHEAQGGMSRLEVS